MPSSLPEIVNDFDPNLDVDLDSGLNQYTDIPEKFLAALSEFAFGLQLEHFFTVHFEIPSIITDQEINDLDHYVKGITTDNIKNALTKNVMFRDLGCLFCRGISLPPFGAAPRIVSPTYRDFKGTPYATPIDTSNQLGITFFDSHISFTDFILRPWAILISHYGLCARDPNDNKGSLINGLRVDLTVTQYSRSGSEIVLDGNTPKISQADIKVTKKWVFNKCAPVDLGSGQDYIQSNTETYTLRKVAWCFEDYKVSII